MLVESDGQVFRGAQKIIQEVEKRIAGVYGVWKIVRLEIHEMAVTEVIGVTEWKFECAIGSEEHLSFEGASIFRFKENKIIHV
ncbi:MAG: hypothetical protein JRN15_24300 [Nitrososphaerota archaeon]|nr:hypothetical protein [Nitrososphaerota archaeon]